MNKTKAIVSLRDEGGENSVEVFNTRKEFGKFSLIAQGLAQGTLGLSLFLTSLSTTISPEVMSEMLIASGGFGALALMIGTVLNLDNINGDLIRAIQKVSSKEHEAVRECIRTAQKGERTLLNSFSVRESVNLDINDFKKPKYRVSEAEGTHIIKHYLIKEKGRYRIEQEVSPNHETIWDYSADALVEVYKVQEKTDSMKEVTA